MTLVVFRLTRDPDGYNQVFAEDCKMEAKSKEGPIFFDYQHDKLAGST